MYGFLFKKSFCDGWDNLLSVIITNLVCLFSGFGLIFLASLVIESTPLLLLVFIFGCAVISVLTFAYGDIAADIANFKGIRIADYFRAIPGALKDGSLFGLMVAVITIVSFIGLDYYFLQTTSLVGIFLGACLLWIDIFLVLSLQWFLPIRSLMHNSFRKCLKKCFIIFFDNTGFSVLIGLYNLVMTALSVLFVGFIPSFAGILIGNTNALRIRLYKYDYLEEHPELKTKKERRQIPWEELIYDDRETLGPRKLKSFIFPWKD